MLALCADPTDRASPERTLCPSEDLLLRWPSFLSRRVSNRFGILAFMMVSNCEGSAESSLCCPGEVDGTGMGTTKIGSRRGARGGRGSKDQKPSGSRLSCKERQEHILVGVSGEREANLR